jgi:alpha-mannosidase
MIGTVQHSTIATLCAIVLSLAGPRVFARPPQPPAFPESMTCDVRPWYKKRPDGTPGREIVLKFGGARLQGATLLDVMAGGKHETVHLSPPEAGVDSASVLLPSDVGVSSQSGVKLTLRQGEKSREVSVLVPPMRHWTVYIFPHSHVDIGYSNTQQNVEFIHKRNIDEGVKLAVATRSYPDGARYTWNTEVMWPFERYYTSASQNKREWLVRAVRSGELSLGAAYVNLLTTASSDEEMIQSLRAGREAARLTGDPVDTYVQVDIPGMAWGLVQVMAHEGVRYVIMMPNGGRGNESVVSTFRYRPFWWVGQDGTSKVLFLNAGMYGAGLEKGGTTGRPWFGQRDRAKIPEVIRTDNPRAHFLDHHLWRELPALESARYPYDIFVTSWALWDNSLLDADLPDAVRSWNNEYVFPHLVIASAHTIMRTIEERYGDRLPVVRGDFGEYWTDGFGTFARQTRMCMNARERLVQAETVWPMLHAAGPAPRAEFDEAWRNVLMCTEHTFGTENPHEPFFQNAIWMVKKHYFQEADYQSRLLLDDALAPASDKTNGGLGPDEGPSEGGVAVINTNSWHHGGLVTLTSAESVRGDRVLDDRGSEMISQRLSSGELVFLSPDVPAFGSSHYRVVAGSCSFRGAHREADTLLDNGTVQVLIDRKTGTIAHMVETASGRDYADAKVNGGLDAFRWMPGRGEGEARPDTVVSVSLSESGPLVGEVKIVSRAPGCRSLVRTVRMVYGMPYVEITNVVDKLPLLPKYGIHFGFGFNLPGAKTRLDIPWGLIQLERDQWPASNRAWVTAQHFVDVSNDTMGVTLCSLDSPLFEQGGITANNTAGWDGKGDVWPSAFTPGPTIYSWVMNNHWFTNTPLTQDGPVAFRYRLLLHGAWDAAHADRFAREQVQPLIAMAARANPIAEPVVAISSDRVVATILKSTADGKAVVLRLRSLSDRDESAKLSWPARTPSSVRVCERGEEPGKKDALREVTVPATGFVTLRVDW